MTSLLLQKVPIEISPRLVATGSNESAILWINSVTTLCILWQACWLYGLYCKPRFIDRCVSSVRLFTRARACTSWNKPQNAGNLVLVVSNNTIMIHDNSRRSVISVLLKFLYHSNVIFNEWIFIPWFPHYNRHRKEQCPCLKLLYVTCVHQNVRCISFCDKVIFKICKR